MGYGVAQIGSICIFAKVPIAVWCMQFLYTRLQMDGGHDVGGGLLSGGEAKQLFAVGFPRPATERQVEKSGRHVSAVFERDIRSCQRVAANLLQVQVDLLHSLELPHVSLSLFAQRKHKMMRKNRPSCEAKRQLNSPVNQHGPSQPFAHHLGR